jgi:beta-galactosidase/beta-glucuronidase
MKQIFQLHFILLLFLYQQAVAQSVPRPEHPQPQFERVDWVNLNGQWTYTFDFGKSGSERGFAKSEGFKDNITVPFCPESRLSGVNYTDFINAMWYQRKIVVPQSWSGRRVIVHFGAVDFESELFIDGKLVGRHYGGTSSFSYDITDNITFGKTSNLVLHVLDDTRSGTQPLGKQCPQYKSYACSYTRTTGIWQTVWLEAVAKNGLLDCQVIPDLDNSRFIFQPRFYSLERGMKFRVKLMDETKIVAQEELAAGQNLSSILYLKNPKTWSPESPFLYYIEYQVVDSKNNIVDDVKSYTGLRKIHIEGNKIFLNNRPVYLRFVLDQGFYPDGVWTAPTDADLKKDIQLSLAAGFNGARLHQKVFEPRFHYWADKLGYLTWGEASSVGSSADNIEYGRTFLSEWEEIVVRDRNHPSIIAWTPFNETYWDANLNGLKQHNRLLSDVYYTTKRIDPTRPVNNASGGYHEVTDLYTTHQYEQNADSLKDKQTIKEPGKLWLYHADQPHIQYQGQPYLLDEIGGFGWIEGKANADNSWGYGDQNKTKESLYTNLNKIIDVIVSFDYIAGYCYTQLTDVEQEQNGIYNYDRTPKFNMSIIKKIFSKEPASFSEPDKIPTK